MLHTHKLIGTTWQENQGRRLIRTIKADKLTLIQSISAAMQTAPGQRIAQHIKDILLGVLFVAAGLAYLLHVEGWHFVGHTTAFWSRLIDALFYTP